MTERLQHEIDEQRIKALERRQDILEREFTELVNDLTAVEVAEDAEEAFMDERQRWMDACRERAAERRRTS